MRTSNCNWNASLTVRCDSPHQFSSPLLTRTHTADFLFVTCNTAILPRCLLPPVTSFPRLINVNSSPQAPPLFDPALRLNSSSHVRIRAPSDSEKRTWSDNLNAPGMSYDPYFGEEAHFTGILISPVLYGTCRRAPPARPLVRAHFACSVYSRDPHSAVLQKYGHAIYPRPPVSSGDSYLTPRSCFR